MIYALLKTDEEVLSKVSPGEQPSDPTLYDRAIHKAYRQGQYRPFRPAHKHETIILLPK
ncbi:MAG: hypothetical protein NVS4B11_19590 [Ktedonobacteraceae bacterium]